MKIVMRAVIASKLRYPRGDAGSIRHEVLGKMLKELGYEVVVVGLGGDSGQKLVEGDISYISLRYGGEEIMNKVKSHLLYLKNLFQFLKTYQPDVILTDDLFPITMSFLRKYCRKRNIGIIHDSVEWYSPEQFKHGKWDIGYQKKDVLNRYVINREFKVIAISQYLYDYFSAKGIECVRIPIVIAEEDLCREKQLDPARVVFTYAGQAGKKDYLHVMLEAFSMLSDEQLSRVEIRIIGCTEEQMLTAGISGCVIDRLRKQLKIYGRVPHEKVLETLHSTDFTLLMRSEEQRYAKAGFPTKVVESWANSTPVICNLTSDLGRYVRDGENGFAVRACSTDALKAVLEKALGLSREDRLKMAGDACQTAEKQFLYWKYLDELKKLAGGCR